MNIIVCIKQVPDTTNVRINEKTNTLIREGVPSIINPFDAYAIEEAVRLKERFGGKTTVISMGPPQAKDALKTAISLGIDEGILLSDRKFAGGDTLATAYTLSKGIEKIGKFDLIICGKQASDGDTAQVGPGIAERLNIPFVAFVKKIEAMENNVIKVERLMEDGYEVVEMPLPALITVVKEINVPRLPSLKGMMKSKTIEIPMWTASDLNTDENRVGLKGSPTEVIRIFTPPQKEKGEIFSGEPHEQVAALVGRLKDKKII